MALTFKVLSALLSYPDERLRAAAPELRAVIAATTERAENRNRALGLT